MKTIIRIFGITLAMLITVVGCSDNNDSSTESISTTTATQKITPAPKGDKIQTHPEGSTIANIAVFGENIKWYAHSHNSHVFPFRVWLLPIEKDSIPPNRPNPPLPLGLLLEDNKFYFATQTINGIESQDELIVGIRLIPRTIH